MCVLVVAGRHEVPLVEPAAAACHGVARLYRAGSWGWGRARADMPASMPRQPHADSVAVIGLVRDQTEPQRVGQGLDSSPCAVGVRVTHHAQVQGTVPAIRQEMDPGG